MGVGVWVVRREEEMGARARVWWGGVVWGGVCGGEGGVGREGREERAGIHGVYLAMQHHPKERGRM